MSGWRAAGNFLIKSFFAGMLFISGVLAGVAFFPRIISFLVDVLSIF